MLQSFLCLSDMTNGILCFAVYHSKYRNNQFIIQKKSSKNSLRGVPGLRTFLRIPK